MKRHLGNLSLLRENYAGDSLAEMDFAAMSMSQQLEHIRRSFYKWLNEQYDQSYDYYCMDVYIDHPVLGSIIINEYQGTLYAVRYTIGDAGELAFEDRASWRPAMKTYVIDEAPEEDEEPPAATEAAFMERGFHDNIETYYRLIDEGAIELPNVVKDEQLNEAVWSTAFVNNLPDSSFLWIAPGCGKKDDQGKTTPRSCRYFPVKDAGGKPDLPHVRNAIARIPQAKHAKLTANLKTQLQTKARNILQAQTSSTKESASQPDLSRTILAEFHESEADLIEGDYIDLILGEPGPGNQRDNHYYTPEMWQANAHKFVDVKMYEVEHDDNKRDNRRWVSTIVEAGKRFTPTGAPIVKAFIHDEDFKKRAEKLKEGGLLDRLHNSIVALGRTKPAQIDGKTYNVVQEIVKPKFVDWVGQAGAGGHALALYENFGPDYDLLTYEQLKQNRPDLLAEISHQRNEPMNDKILTELKETLVETQNEVKALKEQGAGQIETERRKTLKVMVEGSGLSAKSQDRILAQFAEALEENFETKVTAAIEAEKGYLAEVLGAGDVTGLGSGSTAVNEATVIDLEEYNKRAAELDRRFGVLR